MKSLLSVILLVALLVLAVAVESEAACGRRACGRLLGFRAVSRVAAVFPLRGRFGVLSRTVTRHKVVGHAGGKAYVCEGDVCRPAK